ncbi:MAG: hypothetical protein AAGF92_17710 [Myxococcota bacterium]
MATKRNAKANKKPPPYRDPVGRVSTTVLMDRGLHKEIKKRAIDDDLSMSEWIERVCREALGS